MPSAAVTPVLKITTSFNKHMYECNDDGRLPVCVIFLVVLLPFLFVKISVAGSSATGKLGSKVTRRETQV